jgi:hypothetical protein
VVDENRTITADGGGFSGQVGPLAEHVHRVSL